MLTLPSSRRLTHPALFLLAIVAICRVLISFVSISPTIDAYGLTLRSKKTSTYKVHLNSAFNASLTLEEHFTTNHHISHRLQPVPAQLTDSLKCTHEPDPHTNHIRLATVQILNISMVPSANGGEGSAGFKHSQYFNPALIPLPSYSRYPYLLVSRLVTTGAHQESHVCFADVCAPPTAVPVRPDTRLCTDDDIDVLGSNGGMRCVTRPERVNIPPTPARRCTGAWSTFPDIPGFHDPRLFWSGKGEPLIQVNTGSTYGCVGLWLQDLRAVYTPLDDLLSKKAKQKRGDMQKDLEEVSKKDVGMDMIAVGARMGYPHLKELTRNPRDSRNEIEKNWVMFFPTEEEAWVQYDVMGKAFRDNRHAEEDVWSQPSSFSKVPEVLTMSSTATEVGTAVVDDLMRDIGLQKRAANEERPDLDIDRPRWANEQENSADQMVAATCGSPALDSAALARVPSSALGSTSVSSIPAIMPSTASNVSLLPPFAGPVPAQPSASMSPRYQQAVTSIKGGRTIAQLLSHGFATPNLTSPLERPCFNLADHSHEHDSQNNTGHWHQGSNSLRLILCTREQYRMRTCYPTSSSSTADAQRSKQKDSKPMTHDEYENLLIDEGLVVHFSIIHRKFSNPWKLPMRYERYFLLWEARKPFRTLAVSSWPVLLGDERARPWAWEEDVGWDLRQERPARRSEVETPVGDKVDAGKEGQDGGGHPSSYFTYTPSVAWAWKGKSEDEAVHRARGHEDLGTGYLADEVVIGIGIDDLAQGYVKLKVDDVLGCMRTCPGVVDDEDEE